MSQRRGQGWRSKCLKSGAAMALGSGVLLSAGAAHASGYSVARFGGEHGTPMTTNGTSLYYNPGGFAASDGTHVFIDITAAWRSASYQHTVAPSDYSEQAGATDADTAREANTQKASLFNVIPSPSAFVTTKLGDLGLALGFFTPFGGAAKWGKNDDFKDDAKYQGLYDGGQRWYTIDGQLRTSYLSLGVGYNFPDAGLSIGVAGNVLISLVQTLRARNADGSDNIQREGRTYLDATSLDWSIGLGARWAPDDNTAIGVSWQSAPNINGKMRFEGTLTNVYGPEDALAGGSTGDTDFTSNLPNVFRGGVEHKLDPTITLRLFGDYQTWSALKDHCVVTPGGTCDIQDDGTDANGVGTVNQPRHWDDTWGVRAGASYFLDGGAGPELFAGIGYASNAIPDEYLEPALMDFDALTPVAGVRFKVGDSFAIATSYTQVIYFSRDTTGKSVLAGKNPPSKGPDAGGKYSQAIGVLNINADYQF
ncbi:MAG: outer membrane protein transport protein [Polyangiaceae bacterium]